MRLILLPNLLSADQKAEEVFSTEVKKAVNSIEGLIAESEKGARKFLLHFLLREKINIPILLLNEHTKEITPIIKEMEGKRWGLISDAGLPCLADPGSELVFALRSRGVPIDAPGIFCSITKALILSGLKGQRFLFHGYLPRKKEDLHKYLRMLCDESKKKDLTQIFIEAPYRSGFLFSEILKTAPSSCFLSVAQDLSSKQEYVKTYSIKKWKDHSINPKAVSVFLLKSPFFKKISN